MGCGRADLLRPVHRYRLHPYAAGQRFNQLPLDVPGQRLVQTLAQLFQEVLDGPNPALSRLRLTLPGFELANQRPQLAPLALDLVQLLIQSRRVDARGGH